MNTGSNELKMDNLRLLVQEEGRAAKNVVAFHVDLSSPTDPSKLYRKPPTSPRLAMAPGSLSYSREEGSLSARLHKRGTRASSKTGSRVRSASTGRDKKSELQARYWAFLFGNLQRAVDEIYQTCEMDESVSECKEVILVLENFTRDFHNLIEWFKLKWEYENTPPPQRPTSLAWEVRKSSPGKMHNTTGHNVANLKRTASGPASVVKRQLQFCTKSTDIHDPSSLGLSFGDVILEKHLLESENDENAESSLGLNHRLPHSHDSINNPSTGNVATDIPARIDQASQTDIQKSEIAVLKSITKSASLPSVGLANKKIPGLVSSSAVNKINTGSTSTVIGNSKQLGTQSGSTLPSNINNNASPSTGPGKNVLANSFVPVVKSQSNTTSCNGTVPKANTNFGTGRNVSAAAFVPNKKPTAMQVRTVSTPDKSGKSSAISNSVSKAKLATSGINKSVTKTTATTAKNSDPAAVCEESSRSNSSSSLPSVIANDVEAPLLLRTHSSPETRRVPVEVASDCNVKSLSSKIDAPSSHSDIDKEKSTENKSLDVDESKDNPVSVLIGNDSVRPDTNRKTTTSIPVTSKPSISKSSTNEQSTAAVGKVKGNTCGDSVAKPAYAAVSKLIRSHTSADMRSTSGSARKMAPLSGTRSLIAGRTSLDASSRVRSAPVGGRDRANASRQLHQQLNERTPPHPQPASNSKWSEKDEDGWETVKGKSSRWRSNPLSQSSGNIKLQLQSPSQAQRSGGVNSVAAASRFHIPSPATSLPALALNVDSPATDKPIVKQRKERRNAEIKSNRSPTTDSKTPSPAHSEDTKRINEDSIWWKNSFGGLFVSKLEVQRMYEEDLRKSRELFEEELMLTREIRDLEVDTETDGTETDGELTETAGTEEDEGSDQTVCSKALNVLTGLTWADQMETLEKLEALMAQDCSSKGLSWPSRISTLEQLEELVARHPGRAIELHQKLSSPSRRRTLPDTIRRHHARQASAHQKREQLLLDKTAKLRELLSKVGEVKAAQSQLAEERRARLEEKLKRAEEKRNLHLSSIRRKAHDEEEKLREIAFINELEAQNKRHDFMALCQEQEERLQGILEERQRRQEEKAAKEAAVEERRRMLEAERQEKLEKMQERRRKREERIGREQQEKEKERLEMAREKARDREERLQALQAAQLANVEELQKKIQQKQEDSARRHEENIEQIRQRALETAALRTTTEDEAPRLAPYETKKLCVACNILIESEVYLLSHLRGRSHQEALKSRSDALDLAIIIDAPPGKALQDSKLSQGRERQKALRKRCKKIRTRMVQRGTEYENKLGIGATNNGRPANSAANSTGRGRMMKCLKDVERLHSSQGQGQWPNNAITQLERSLSEVNRILSKKSVADQNVFRELDGFTILNNILNLGLDVAKNMKPYIPPKCFVTACTAYILASQENVDSFKYIVLTNKLSLVLDLLQKQLDVLIPEHWQGARSTTSLPVDPVAGALMRLLAVVLDNAGSAGDDKNNNNKEKTLAAVSSSDLAPALQDIVSYSVSIGMVDRLAVYCGGVRDSLDSDPQTASFLLSAIQLLTAFSSLKCYGTGNGANLDPTQLVATLRATELMGGVSMLYGMLLHQGAPAREPDCLPPPLPTHTLAVASATVRLLNTIARMHLAMFQSVLESEGLSLQFRHIASYLMWYCTGQKQQLLLHQLVPLIGYFAINHRDNQMMLQSGGMPTVLQQLCSLPFEYFSKPELSQVLFPTLLACCKNNPGNKAILEQELTYQMLEDFLKTCSSNDQNNKNLLIELILK